MFTYKTKIRLHDTDAAGIIFFANQFKLIHDAYEDLLEKFGWSFEKMLKRTDYFLPIVHAESDYKTSVFVGDKIVIGIRVGHIGNTSFSFEYTLKRGKTLVGTAKTVHVTINQKTHKKMPLPAAMRRALARYQSASR
jgi:1,4-dihydroxy-2-naphthoyl-CoA hydrolase